MKNTTALAGAILFLPLMGILAEAYDWLQASGILTWDSLITLGVIAFIHFCIYCHYHKEFAENLIDTVKGMLTLITIVVLTIATIIATIAGLIISPPSITHVLLIMIVLLLFVGLFVPH